jgi:hypothetical protein
MATIINKPNSQTFAKITKEASGKFCAAVMQGQGFEQVFWGSASFKSKSRARSWIKRVYGF